ncbi:MAG: DUF4097 domain-containing protein [Flammeovirgaceae bacterium]|nr:DUF4097 domain-containing protein [Flammeovirgaceae bacterium]
MKALIYTCAILFSGSVIAQNKGDFHLDKEYKINPVGTIKLKSSDAKVTIVGSDRKDVHVKIDREVTSKGMVFGSEEFTVEITEEGGNLIIEEKSESVNVTMIGYYSEKYTILIEAPDGNSLLVKGDDGDHSIKNIDGSISLTLDDGDANLSGCNGNDFKFRMDDGDLTMDAGGGNLDIDFDDGDVEIRNGKFASVLAKIDDGDFVLETTLVDNGEYDIRAEDGSVSLTVLGGGGDFNIRHDDGRVITDSDTFSLKEKSEDRTFLTLKDGHAKINIRVDDGRVRLAAR